MNLKWGGIAWILWVSSVLVAAALQSQEERWILAFSVTSALLLLDLYSLHYLAKVLLRPRDAPPQGLWKRRASAGAVVVLRIAPWIGLAWILKTIAPGEAPIAHLLGWASLPMTVLGSALISRIFKKKTE